MNRIHIEFFGIARQRVGEPSTTVAADGPTPLSIVLSELENRFPELAPDCIQDGRLSKTCAANLNGDRFISDSDFTLRPTDRLLIMSADAGG